MDWRTWSAVGETQNINAQYQPMGGSANMIPVTHFGALHSTFHTDPPLFAPPNPTVPSAGVAGVGGALADSNIFRRPRSVSLPDCSVTPNWVDDSSSAGESEESDDDGWGSSANSTTPSPGSSPGPASLSQPSSPSGWPQWTSRGPAGVALLGSIPEGTEVSAHNTPTSTGNNTPSSSHTNSPQPLGPPAAYQPRSNYTRRRKHRSAHLLRTSGSSHPPDAMSAGSTGAIPVDGSAFPLFSPAAPYGSGDGSGPFAMAQPFRAPPTRATPLHPSMPQPALPHVHMNLQAISQEFQEEASHFDAIYQEHWQRMYDIVWSTRYEQLRDELISFWPKTRRFFGLFQNLPAMQQIIQIDAHYYQALVNVLVPEPFRYLAPEISLLAIDISRMLPLWVFNATQFALPLAFSEEKIRVVRQYCIIMHKRASVNNLGGRVSAVLRAEYEGNRRDIERSKRSRMGKDWEKVDIAGATQMFAFGLDDFDDVEGRPVLPVQPLVAIDVLMEMGRLLDGRALIEDWAKWLHGSVLGMTGDQAETPKYLADANMVYKWSLMLSNILTELTIAKAKSLKQFRLLFSWIDGVFCYVMEQQLTNPPLPVKQAAPYGTYWQDPSFHLKQQVEFLTGKVAALEHQLQSTRLSPPVPQHSTYAPTTFVQAPQQPTSVQPLPVRTGSGSPQTFQRPRSNTSPDTRLPYGMDTSDMSATTFTPYARLAPSPQPVPAFPSQRSQDPSLKIAPDLSSNLEAGMFSRILEEEEDSLSSLLGIPNSKPTADLRYPLHRQPKEELIPGSGGLVPAYPLIGHGKASSAPHLQLSSALGLSPTNAPMMPIQNTHSQPTSPAISDTYGLFSTELDSFQSRAGQVAARPTGPVVQRGRSLSNPAPVMSDRLFYDTSAAQPQTRIQYQPQQPQQQQKPPPQQFHFAQPTTFDPQALFYQKP